MQCSTRGDFLRPAAVPCAPPAWYNNNNDIDNITTSKDLCLLADCVKHLGWRDQMQAEGYMPGVDGSRLTAHHGAVDIGLNEESVRCGVNLKSSRRLAEALAGAEAPEQRFVRWLLSPFGNSPPIDLHGWQTPDAASMRRHWCDSWSQISR